MIQIKNLRVEYLEYPLSIPTLYPRFSWQIESSSHVASFPVGMEGYNPPSLSTSRGGYYQSAYQIQVGSSKKEFVPNFWDSGKVISSQQIGIVYAGEPLKSQSQLFWRVRVWNQLDEASESALSCFEIGLMEVGEWQGKWIATPTTQSKFSPPLNLPPARVPLFKLPPAPMVRRKFSLPKPATMARSYVSALGYYELYLNGQKVGSHVLAPVYSDYNKRIYYNSYDVTDFLQPGENCVGAILGQGWWWDNPALLLQLNIFLEDGQHISVVTDEKWHWAWSPISSHSLYHGEIYDARLEQDHWAKAGGREKNWQPVQCIHAPSRNLSPQMIQPIQVISECVPQKITSPRPNTLVYDFGQNFSGWCRLAAVAKAGTEITLQHAELVYPEYISMGMNDGSNLESKKGLVNQETLFDACATDTYKTKGKGIETYEPRFTYHGFRYVQVEAKRNSRPLSLQVLPSVSSPSGKAWDFSLGEAGSCGSLEGRVVHTGFAPRGHFACSNELINRIHHNALWSFRSNFFGFPTDCPQRNERWGWLGDAHMTCDMGLYNFDIEAAYIKFLQDIQDSMGEDGSIPDAVPQRCGYTPGDPMWTVAYPQILWDVYRHCGDQHLLACHYEAIQCYVKALVQEAPNFILERNIYGDWLGIVRTPSALISTGGFLLAVRILSKVAHILSKSQDAQKYESLCQSIAAAFQERFFDQTTGQYGNGSQFSNLFPLYLQIVPHLLRPKVVEHLVNDLVAHDKHLSTGFMGTRYLLHTLVQENQAELAYSLVTQETYPGWGYMVQQGATTFWESWNADIHVRSHNHLPLAFISGWFYSALAGLIPDEDSPGWQHFLIKPGIVGDLTWVEASLHNLRGRISVRWERSPGLRLKAVIPPNSSASVYLPKMGYLNPVVLESGVAVWKEGNIAGDKVFSGKELGQYIIFTVPSGEYCFEITR